MTTTPAFYRPDVDGLRGVAIMLVVLYHIQMPWFEAGFVGVDLFFVISGYVITHSLWRDGVARGRVDVFAFYLRRVRRLLPALLVMVVSVLAVCAVVMGYYDLSRVLAQAVAALGYSTNLHLWLDQRDYFHAQVAYQPFMHTWSLAVEEHFYLLYPWVVLWAMRRGWCGGRMVWSLAVCVVLSGLSYVVAYRDAAYMDGFYLSWNRFWELGAGCVVAWWQVSTPMPHKHGTRWAVWVVELLVVVCAVGAALEASTGNPLRMAWGTLYAVAAAVGVLLCGAHPASVLGRVLRCSLLVGIGEIAYPLYLWHWGLLVLSRIIWLEELALLHRLLLVQGCFVLAFLSHRYVEMPWRARRDGWFADGAVWRMAGAVWLGVFLLCWGGVLVLQQWVPSVGLAERLAATRSVSNPREQACNARPKHELKETLQRACILGKLPLLGTQHQGLLLGDSHADHLAVAVDILAQRSGVGVMQRTRFGCLGLLYPKDVTHPEDCGAFNEESYALAKENASLRFIVLSGSWAEQVQHQLITPDNLRRALELTLQRFAALGLDVLLVQQVPRATGDGDLERCAQKVLRSAQTKIDLGVRCTTPQQATQYLASSNTILREVVAKVAASVPQKIILAEPMSGLCFAHECVFYDTNGLFYRDASHLNAHGSAHLVGVLAPAWKAVVPSRSQ